MAAACLKKSFMGIWRPQEPIPSDMSATHRWLPQQQQCWPVTYLLPTTTNNDFRVSYFLKGTLFGINIPRGQCHSYEVGRVCPAPAPAPHGHVEPRARISVLNLFTVQARGRRSGRLDAKTDTGYVFTACCVRVQWTQ